MNIYVGNLPHSASEDKIRDLFAAHGTVDSVRIMIDKFTNQPRGFCFVSMPNDQEAQNAIHALNNIDFEGNSIRVNEARPPRRFDNNRGGGSNGGGQGRGGFGRRPSYNNNRF